MSCSVLGGETWCPGRSEELLPAILAHPETERGLNQELAVSNGFRFGLRFPRKEH